MKVLIIGGTGLLGSQAAWELYQRGHQVRGLSLPPLPDGAAFPPGMEHRFGSYLEISDEELSQCMEGCQGLVFAAGVDERVKARKPSLEFFRKYNNRPLERILRLAKPAGIRHAVVLGSYFSHFNRAWPEFELARHHPYIRSRVEQEEIAMAAAGEGFAVSVLELPYIFGTQPGRKPVWVFLADMIDKMKPFTLFPRGGTAMVTVRQTGQAIAGALEKSRGGQVWPISAENHDWRWLIAAFHRGLGTPGKRIITIPTWMFRLGTVWMRHQDRRKGLEGGLDLPKFAPVMAREAYIDPALGCGPLGVQPDDLNAALADSVRVSVDALRGKKGLLGMQTE